MFSLRKKSRVLETLELRHFRLDEFACKCGCGALPTNDLMRWCDDVREELGMEFQVNSAMRCLEYNRSPEVGSNDASQHPKGVAVDVACPNSSYRFKILEIALKKGVKGIGSYGFGWHFDLREGEPVCWRGSY